MQAYTCYLRLQQWWVALLVCAYTVKCSAILAAAVKDMPGALQECTVACAAHAPRTLSLLQGVFGKAAGKCGTIKTEFFSSGTMDALAAALQACYINWFCLVSQPPKLPMLVSQCCCVHDWAQPAVVGRRYCLSRLGLRITWHDADARTVQAVSCKNVRHLGGNRAAEDLSSCLAPGLFSAAATFWNAVQVGWSVTCCM